MNQPHWQTLLANRGILDAALEVGWQPDGSGWKYPVATADGQVIHRWKAFNGNSGSQKYLWPDGKPDGVKYYLLPGATDAINATGEVYRASGEPDVLAYWSAGIHNVLCWFGEGNVPATVQDDLTSMGALTVKDYPDLDKTGQDSALKVVRMLPGFDVQVYKLPDELGDAGDINKLWITSKFDRDTFRYILDNLPRIEVQNLQSALPDVDHPDSLEDFPTAFYEAIERALNVTAYESDGWSKSIKCPLRQHEHDQDRPAGGWHKTKHIFYCHKCAASSNTGHVLAKDVANALGIDFREYIPKRQQPLRLQPKKLTPDPVEPRVEKLDGIYSWDQATEHVVDELLGEVESTFYDPIPMPFNSFSQFQGLAKMLLPRKMAAIVADSGDGKTSFIETLVDSWRKLGFSGILFGPEWSKEECVYRAIQRQGGPTYMQVIDHRAYYAAYKRGTPENRRPGRPLTDAETDRGITLAQEIECWPGKIWFVEKMSISVDQLIERMSDIVVGCAQQGERISFFVVDYAQLLGTASERISEALSKIKSFCVDNDMVGVVASQVPKETGKDMASGNARLTHHAMQSARSDVFNLVLTINRELNEDARRSPYAAIRIAKNSLGTTGETTLFQDERLLLWSDTKPKEYG